MKIENASRRWLVIPGVFDGQAGVSGGYLSFVPNHPAKMDPAEATLGIFDGKVKIAIAPTKDSEGPFWTTAWVEAQ